MWIKNLMTLIGHFHLLGNWTHQTIINYHWLWDEMQGWRKQKPIQLPKNYINAKSVEQYFGCCWPIFIQFDKGWELKSQSIFVINLFATTGHIPFTVFNTKTHRRPSGYLKTEICATLGQIVVSYSIFGGCSVRCTNRTIYIFSIVFFSFIFSCACIHSQ